MLFWESYAGEFQAFHNGHFDEKDEGISVSKNYDVSNWSLDDWSKVDMSTFELLVSKNISSDILEYLGGTDLGITLFDITEIKTKTETSTIEPVEDEPAKERPGISKKVFDILKKVEKTTGLKFQTFESNSDRTRYKDVIPSGLTEVDYHLLGVGGIVPGRIYEFFGPEGAGKTTLCHLLMGSSQRVHEDKEDSIAILIDVENAFDPARAEALGVNLSRLVICQPNVVDNASDALKMLLDEVVSGNIHISSLTWDSIAAIQTAREYAQEAATGEMMGRAMFMAKFLRQILGRLADSKCPLFMINQVRDNITAMGARGFSTPGGRAVKHSASVRIEVKRVDFIGPKDEPIGQTIKLKTLKNRFESPFRTCEINLYFDSRPFRFEESLLVFAIREGVIERRGGTHLFRGEKIASSRGDLLSRVEAMIKGNDEDLRRIFELVKSDIHNKYYEGAEIVEDDGKADIEVFEEVLKKEEKRGLIPEDEEEDNEED